MLCVDCQREVPDQHVRCIYCGGLPEGTVVLHCSDCERPIPPEKTTCPYCGGSPLDEGAVAQKGQVTDSAMFGEMRFHGNALALFVRLLAAGLISTATLGIAGPWAYVIVLRYILNNTEIGGRHMEFYGKPAEMLVPNLVMTVLIVLTFGIYLPWAICRWSQWITSNTWYGEEPLGWCGRPRSLFSHGVCWTVLTVLTGGLYGYWATTGFFRWYAASTSFQGRSFRFVGSGLSWLFQMLIMTLLLTVTAGLYYPWAVVRALRWTYEKTRGGIEDNALGPPMVDPTLAIATAGLCALLTGGAIFGYSTLDQQGQDRVHREVAAGLDLARDLVVGNLEGTPLQRPKDVRIDEDKDGNVTITNVPKKKKADDGRAPNR